MVSWSGGLSSWPKLTGGKGVHLWLALDFLQEAWTEARLNGVDDDCMAQICLFTAFSELVSTYGEEAAARYAEGLSRRISNGEFSIELARQ